MYAGNVYKFKKICMAFYGMVMDWIFSNCWCKSRMTQLELAQHFHIHASVYLQYATFISFPLFPSGQHLFPEITKCLVFGIYRFSVHSRRMCSFVSAFSKTGSPSQEELRASSQRSRCPLNVKLLTENVFIFLVTRLHLQTLTHSVIRHSSHTT